MKSFSDVLGARASSSTTEAVPALIDPGARDLDCHAVVPRAAVLSQPTETAVMRFEQPHPDIGPDRSLVTAAVFGEARLAAAQERARSRPATTDDWRAFLLPLCATKPAAPEIGPAFDAAIDSMILAFDPLPVCLLTRDLLAAMMRGCEFFPRPPDLEKYLRPAILERSRRVTALNRILASGVAVQASSDQAARAGERTPDELAHVAAKLAEAKTQLVAVSAARDAGRPKLGCPMAVPLAPAQLARAYREQIADAPSPEVRAAMAIRAASIEASLPRPREGRR